MNGVIVNLMLFINLFAGSVALENMGYKYVFVSPLCSLAGFFTTPNGEKMKIFVGWDCFEAFFWWLFAVETVGKSLEELEEVFDLPYPARGLPEMKEQSVDIEKDKI